MQKSKGKITTQNSKLKIGKYLPSEIEPKWRKKWKESGLYDFSLDKDKPKYYTLVELPYPSGDLHIGHWFAFVTPDVLSRFKRMQGFNVFFPMGYDAFGLPAENAAIKRGIHPQDWTIQNIETMTKQFETMGTMIDWKRVTITCLPEYYKWNQWIFIEMFKKGIAYRSKTLSNWCPVDQTVLANEHVEDGKCWRCGTEVVQKEVEQWFLKITAYAERLLWRENESTKKSSEEDLVGLRDLPNDWIDTLKSNIPQKKGIVNKDRRGVDLPGVEPGRRGVSIQSSKPAKPTPPSVYNEKEHLVNGVDWPQSVREGQNNWIGKSEGMIIDFGGANVFTTMPETTDGATFVVLSPEHKMVEKLTTNEQKDKVKAYVKIAKSKNELERKENKEKTGVFTGSFVQNPVTGKEIPVWVADYVLYGYGTGAIMAVPFADEKDREFAEKFDLPIIETTFKAVPKGEKLVNYHLHDWSVSRQRYWGTPVPFVYCVNCWKPKAQSQKRKAAYGRDYSIIEGKKYAMIPVPLENLPVELPYDVDYTPKGKPPLASNEKWLKTSCPKCGGEALRDAETLDTFFDSSWYYYRYVDPSFEKGPFDPVLAEKLLPLEIYFGGAEHTLGHTLYARFFTKFFEDLGLVDFDEFAKKRIQHGIVLGPDGNKMSKSKGNVINPDDVVKEFGSDAVRLYLAFMMPYEATAPWSREALYGTYRFLKRVWELSEKCQMSNVKCQMSNEDLYQMHRTIKKVGEDIEHIKMNTAVAALMEWLNYLSRKSSESRTGRISFEEYKTLLLLLAPFAPHMSEELWERLTIDHLSFTIEKKNRKSSIVNYKSIHLQPWPKYDEKYLVSNKVTIVVQVNGKVRDNLKCQISNVKSQKDVEEKARESEKVKKYLTDKPVKKVVYIEGKLINFVTE